MIETIIGPVLVTDIGPVPGIATARGPMTVNVTVTEVMTALMITKAAEDLAESTFLLYFCFSGFFLSSVLSPFFL